MTTSMADFTVWLNIQDFPCETSIGSSFDYFPTLLSHMLIISKYYCSLMHLSRFFVVVRKHNSSDLCSRAELIEVSYLKMLAVLVGIVCPIMIHKSIISRSLQIYHKCDNFLPKSLCNLIDYSF